MKKKLRALSTVHAIMYIFYRVKKKIDCEGQSTGERHNVDCLMLRKPRLDARMSHDKTADTIHFSQKSYR